MTDRVLITGGAQRLGAELVRAFAGAGWEVWCHYQHSDTQANALRAELRDAGQTVHLARADLSREEQVVALVRDIAEHAGPLRTVVSNASLFEPDTGAAFDPARARAQLEVNLIAPMLLGRELARQHAQRPGTDASMIHVLDQKIYNLNPDYFSYTASKLALERVISLQAQALAPAIRVCGVAPGLMYLSGPQKPENFERASRINLLRKPIDPADVARACLFMARTASITGTTLCVDNGQHLVPLERDVMFVVDELFAAAGGAHERA